MLKQLIPENYCLKCLGCCRFKEAGSVWLPCLMDEEIQALLDKKIPSVCLSRKKKLQPLDDGHGGFVCPFLQAGENKCRIYQYRPFECQLYPFLINLRNNKVVLTLDLNCPYVQENLKTPEFKKYTGYLAGFMNSPEQLALLRDNPHLLQAYEAVGEIIELNP